MHKIILVITGLIVVGFVGTCIYFVGGVSATIPPIKKYEFSGSVDQLLSGIQKFALTDSDITFQITERTGNKQNGYGTYFDIKIKIDTSIMEYNLECEKSSKGKDVVKTLIQLIGAHNEMNYAVGGYGINGTGVKSMVKDFEIQFLGKLKIQQHIVITPYQ